MEERTEHWIRRGQHKAIALLHGIGAGDPRQYWSAYLTLLQADPDLQEYGLFVWKYPTHRRPGLLSNLASSASRKTLRQTAPDIALLGALWDTTYRAQLSGYDEVFLICHSMGGLVVKAWIIDSLEQGQGDRLNALRHIAFYATPHNGAPITTLSNWNKQLRDMQLTSPFIQQSGEHWHRKVVAWQKSPPDARDNRYNRFIPHLALAGASDLIVPAASATIQDIPLTLVEGDHQTVIQPIDTADTRYKVWRDAFDAFSRSTTVSQPSSPEPASSAAAQPSAQVQHSSASMSSVSQQPGAPSSPPQSQQSPAPAAQSPASPAAQASQQAGPSQRQDFFISYAPDDQPWAEWIALQLEQAGHTIRIEAWDFRPGSNLILETDNTIRTSNRTLLVLTPAYLQAALTQAHWSTVFLSDPTGAQKHLLPVRVEPCDIVGLLGSIIPIDLIGLDEAQAQARLLAGIQPGRARPATAAYPQHHPSPASFPPASPAVQSPAASQQSQQPSAYQAASLQTAQPASSQSEPATSTPSRYHSCVISYATEDEPFVSKLYTDLKAHGVPCWLASQDLKIGDKLRAGIYQAIDQHNKLLLVLSHSALASSWVEEEIDAVLDREHRTPGEWLLFPLFIDNAIFTSSKYWAVTVRQRYSGDFTRWQDDSVYQKALQRVLRDLYKGDVIC